MSQTSLHISLRNDFPGGGYERSLGHIESEQKDAATVLQSEREEGAATRPDGDSAIHAADTRNLQGNRGVFGCATTEPLRRVWRVTGHRGGHHALRC